MQTRTTILSIASGAVLGTALLLTPTAHAQTDPGIDEEASAQGSTARFPLSLRLEPGLAMAVTNPQSQLTDAGFAQTVKLHFGLSRYLEIGPSLTYTTLPADASMADSGTSWTFGAGARLMRPHDAAPGRGGFRAASPWIDADLLFVRTGDLNRPGFAAAVGLAVPIDEQRRFWIGPFVRYFQIVQGDREGFDNRDAQVLSFGLSLEVGSGIQRTRAPAWVAADEEPEPEVVATVAETPAEPVPAADRDGDGISDDDDVCPDVAGDLANEGCPPYEKVVVKRDKLEVKEKIAFAWDSAELDAASYPALDEVVRALKDNPGFRVQVDGHASSDGAEAHNQTLSEERAATVLDYLVAHGIAKERLASKGLSSSEPIETNQTVAGRESNRRVEFVVHFIILNDGNTP
jgi:outer membrane protein OmpA-like peptidoglycan-associated protein